MKAAEIDEADNFKHVLESNPNWHEPSKWLSLADKKGRTALHVASMHGHLNIVRFIVNEIVAATTDFELRKQYINMTDSKGRTPLFFAASFGFRHIHICIPLNLVFVI